MYNPEFKLESGRINIEYTSYKNDHKDRYITYFRLSDYFYNTYNMKSLAMVDPFDRSSY